MAIAGHDVHIPHMIHALSKCAISPGGIQDLGQIDLLDIEDMVHPETTLALPAWRSGLGSAQPAFPCGPAEVESALSSNILEPEKVMCTVIYCQFLCYS
jgi:hypothetical protein